MKKHEKIPDLAEIGGKGLDEQLGLADRSIACIVVRTERCCKSEQLELHPAMGPQEEPGAHQEPGPWHSGLRR